MRLASAPIRAVVASLFFAPALEAQPENPTPFQQRITTAMQGDIRTPEERARDANRLPVEITVAEISLEAFYPADDFTAGALNALSHRKAAS